MKKHHSQETSLSDFLWLKPYIESLDYLKAWNLNGDVEFEVMDGFKGDNAHRSNFGLNSFTSEFVYYK